MDDSIARNKATNKSCSDETSKTEQKAAAKGGEDEFQDGPRPTHPHTYRDYANSRMLPPPAEVSIKARGGVVNPFPLVLHTILERAEVDQHSHIVSWMPHGRSFQIHDRDRFTTEILSLYSRQTQYASFQRQLNLYSFRRFWANGPDYGSYYHELFLRGRPDLCAHINRSQVNGNGVRLGSSPSTEPNLYAMPPAGPSSVKTRNQHAAVPQLAALNQAVLPQDPLQFNQAAEAAATAFVMGDGTMAETSASSAAYPRTTTDLFSSAVPPPPAAIPLPQQIDGHVQVQEAILRNFTDLLLLQSFAGTFLGQASVPLTNEEQAQTAIFANTAHQEEQEAAAPSQTQETFASYNTLAGYADPPQDLAEIADMVHFLRDVDLDTHLDSSCSEKNSDESLSHFMEESSILESLSGQYDEASKRRASHSDESLKTQGTNP